MLLFKNALVYSPAATGRRDLLVAGGRLIRLEAGVHIPESYCEVIDATHLLAVPGFVDGHVHVTGGGGEGGYATRTPELPLSDAVRGGITTVVGCLGTDGVTRSLASVLAKVRALEEEGITAFMYTGCYAVPVRTLTGSIESDLLLIDKVIGVGEIALSDHRSTQPTFEEFARLTAEARRGGILSGKSGVVNVHLGDGARRLSMLRRLVTETEIPAGQVVPTHVNRNPELFADGVEYAKGGGLVDLTTSTVPSYLEEGEVKASAGVRRLLEAGVDVSRITLTSDGQGSLPNFDANGHLRGLDVGRVTSLFAAVREAVLEEKIPLEIALQPITSSPARTLRLRGKGQLAAGCDGDIVLLAPETLEIRGVVAKGRWLMKDGEVVVRGTFE